MSTNYYLGLDLGQQSDYTALTAVRQAFEREQERVPVKRGGVSHKLKVREVLQEYQLKHLERFDLGTPYRTIAEEVRALQEKPPLRSAPVIADTTGVGLPVFEMLEAEGVRPLYGVTITGGTSVSEEDRIWSVPKRDLVSTMQVLLQNRQLRFARGLSGAKVLRKELQNFKVKIDTRTGHGSYEHWREGDHDDLVLSLAMACWFAEYRRNNKLPKASKSRVYNYLTGQGYRG